MADKKQQIRRPDEMPDHRAQLPHSSHSLSHGSAITATNGHLMPVYYDFLNAGEVVDLAIPFELITEPLVSYARAHLTVHTEFFFVPMQLLYQPFGDWYYNVKEQFSTQFEDAVRKLPLLNLEGTLDTVQINRQSADYLSYECYGRRVARLFDLLDYPSNYIFMSPDYEVGVSDPLLYYSTFPYGLLAYNCIYEYFYRLDNRETFRPQLFNVDKFYSTGLITLSNTDLLRMCSIKYRPLDNDYFTDMKVSPIVDVLNMNVQTELAVADSWLSRSTFTNSNSATVNVLSSGGLGLNVGNSNANTSPMSQGNPSQNIQTNFGFIYSRSSGSSNSIVNGFDINTANIRAMFASEKLWSITGRAKKRYDDQTLAHFGFKVPHDPKHEISRFGHDVTPIDIGMVIATGASSETPLGEIAGKGRAELKSPKHHRFTAPCHGVVMAIMSIVPEIYYNKYRSKYTVVRSRDDLYTPEYDHLGLQPLFGYEEGLGIYSSDGVEVDNASKIMGWQYRYEQWKRRFNKVSPAFDDYGVRKTWMISRDASLNSYSGDYIYNAPNTESFYLFLHSPLSANSIFVPQYSGLWSEQFDENPTSAQMYDLDPYTITLDVQSSKLSTMSDYSLPRLDA